MRYALEHVHHYAKRICEGPNPTRLAVLVEGSIGSLDGDA